MGRPIQIKKPIPEGEKTKLALNILFKGKEQIGFFKFRRIAEGEPFVMDATRLARLLILDFVKEVDAKMGSVRVGRIEKQITLLKEKKAKAGGR